MLFVMSPFLLQIYKLVGVQFQGPKMASATKNDKYHVILHDQVWVKGVLTKPFMDILWFPFLGDLRTWSIWAKFKNWG